MKWTRSERFSLLLLRFIPPVVAAAPERILINAACVLIGIGSVTPAAGSLLALWPRWLAFEWGAAMMVGGALTLVGIVRQKLGPERAGMVLIMLCTFFFALDAVLTIHLRALPTALIFLGITLAKLVRLILSSASRAHLTHRPPEEDQGLS